MVVLRATAPISGVPIEGSSPLIGEMIGSSIVRFNESNSSFTDTSLINGNEYFYRIFTKDAHGNYSAPAFQVSGTPGLFGTGTIQGRVTHADTGCSLRDVVVQIIETGQSVTTKGNGKYTLSDDPADDHKVMAFKTGYVDQGKTVTVNAEETSALDFTLVPG